MAPFPWLERKKLKHSLLSTSWLQMRYDQLLHAPDVGLLIISPSFCKLLLPTYFITTTATECNSSSVGMFIAANLSSLFNSVSSQGLLLLTPFSLVSVLRFPDIFLICDNFTEWYILDYRGLCCCPIVTGLWLYCQRISYHCSAITFDLTCGDCI